MRSARRFSQVSQQIVGRWEVQWELVAGNAAMQPCPEIQYPKAVPCSSKLLSVTYSDLLYFKALFFQICQIGNKEQYFFPPRPMALVLIASLRGLRTVRGKKGCPFSTVFVPRSLQIPPMQSFLTILEIWPNGLGSKDSDHRSAALRWSEFYALYIYIERYHFHVGLHNSHTYLRWKNTYLYIHFKPYMIWMNHHGCSKFFG